MTRVSSRAIQGVDGELLFVRDQQPLNEPCRRWYPSLPYNSMKNLLLLLVHLLTTVARLLGPGGARHMRQL
jgi:hypothetical protein